MSADLRDLIEPLGRRMSASAVDVEDAMRTGQRIRTRRRIASVTATLVVCAAAITASVVLTLPTTQVAPVVPSRPFPAVDFAGYGLSDPITTEGERVSLQQATAVADRLMGTTVAPEVTLRMSSGLTLPRLKKPVPTWVFVYRVAGHSPFTGPATLTAERKRALDDLLVNCTTVFMVDATTGAAGAGGQTCGPMYPRPTPNPS